MTTTKRVTRQFLILADETVEEILDDGAATAVYRAPDLYGDLVFAGYPLVADTSSTFDGCIDVVTDGQKVIAQTNGQPPHEHDMGGAAELFLAWYRANAAGEA